MDCELLKRIKQQDRQLRKLLVENSPTDIIEFRLNTMKSLIKEIPSEHADLVKCWSDELELHWTSFLLRSPVREPNPAVGPVPVVATPQIVHKSASSLQVEPQPKKTVTIHKVYDYPLRPERAQQAKTTVDGSESPDKIVKPILKSACDHHHCSNCNRFDVNQYDKPKQASSSWNGDYQLSGASGVSSSTRSIGHDAAKQTSYLVTTPSTAMTISNQTGQNNSFVQRSLKRTSQTLDQSIAPRSSSSASLHQSPKRSRTSTELIRARMIALLSATPPMYDYEDVDSYKPLLRTVQSDRPT